MKALRILLLLFVCAVIGSAFWLNWALHRRGPDHEIEMTVNRGAPMVHVLEELQDRGLLPSPFAGRLYIAFRAKDRSFRYGRYVVPSESRPVDVIEQLLEGRVETLGVTVVEGSTADEVAAVLAGAGLGTVEEWQPILKDPGWISDLAPEATGLEGFLFPDTYRFAVGLSAHASAEHMVSRFRQVWSDLDTTAPEPWGTTMEVVTMASLVEAETSVPEERSRIAGVFMNRLRRGMLLQCDPTVVYALKRRGEWEGRLLRIHWQVDDPYNTYRFPGLPPAPINSPGRAALSAALAPEEHAELYFVAKPGGGHAFSTNLRDHNRAVARLRSSRR